MDISSVAVVGMGTMGRQIGIVTARAGFPTARVDVAPEQVERGLSGLESWLAGQVKRGKMEPEIRETVLSRISVSTDIQAAAAGADLVIEAVPEEIALKKRIFGRLDESAPEQTILASNTSTLWITEIAAATGRPEKCIGTHFLIPAALTPLVEVVRGVATSDQTHQTVVEFLTRCGKETVTAADSPGFVINRLYLPLVNEAFFALGEGLAGPEEIDRSCTRGLGFPLGPLAAADAFGLDILLACMQTFHRELGEKYRPAPGLVKLVKAGRLGRKTAKGVYDYSAER
jgi:3-hydroxybutyryl-CoA dehydrogenase